MHDQREMAFPLWVAGTVLLTIIAHEVGSETTEVELAFSTAVLAIAVSCAYKFFLKSTNELSIREFNVLIGLLVAMIISTIFIGTGLISLMVEA